MLHPAMVLCLLLLTSDVVIQKFGDLGRVSLFCDAILYQMWYRMFLDPIQIL